MTASGRSWTGCCSISLPCVRHGEGRRQAADQFRLEDVVETAIATTPRSEPLVPAIVAVVRRYYAMYGNLGEPVTDDARHLTDSDGGTSTANSR